MDKQTDNMTTVKNSDGSEEIQYDYPDFQVSIHKRKSVHVKDYNMLPHWHEDFELCYVTSGRLNYYVNGQQVILNEGSCILVNSRQVHYPEIIEDEPSTFLMCIINPSVFGISSKIYLKYIAPIQKSAPYFVLSNNVSWQSDIINSVQKIFDNKKNPSFELLLIANFSFILGNIYMGMNLDSSDNDPSNYAHVEDLRTMMQFIHTNYREKITLNNIAASVGICKTACNSIFKTGLNMSPIEYLISYRLIKSIELMKNENMSINDIALESGFSSSSFYAETFKKRYSVSPTSYRRESVNRSSVKA